MREVPAAVEGQPLLPEREQNEWRHFLPVVTFSLVFSLSHGSFTSLMALTSSLVREADAGVANGLCYLFNGIGSLAFATVTLASIGFKKTMVFALFLLIIYSAAFAIALYIPWKSGVLGWVSFGGICAGIATALFWTAQGIYIASASADFAHRGGVPLATATAIVSSTFSTMLLTLEFFLKLLSWGVLRSEPKTAAGGVSSERFTLLMVHIGLTAFSAVSSPFLIFELKAPGESSDRGVKSAWQLIGDRLYDCIGLMRDDPSIFLLAPFNMSFVMIGAFLTAQVNAQLIAVALGPSSVGLTGAVNVGFAAIASFFSSWARDNKVFALYAAVVGFALELALMGVAYAIDLPSLVTAHRFSRVGSWALILAIILVHGFCRAIYESSNRALTAELFSDRPNAAFANTSLQVAVGGFVSFFAFPHTGAGGSIAMCAVPVVIAIPCLVFAVRRRKAESWAAGIIGHGKQRNNDLEGVKDS